MRYIVAMLARRCPGYHDDVWLVDSAPVECGRRRQTAQHSDLAGWATYGCCASRSRYFWGLRLHIIATPSGLPVAYALTGARADERQTALDMIAVDPDLARPRQILIADRGYRSATLEHELDNTGITLIRPALNPEKPPPVQQFLRPFRQIIESANQTRKAQLDIERHGGRKPDGVAARILQRLLALTTAIWHHETTNQPGPARSLIAYDHWPPGTTHLGRAQPPIGALDLDAGGSSIISYDDHTNEDQQVARCDGANFAAAITTLYSARIAGQYASSAVGSSGPTVVTCHGDGYLELVIDRTGTVQNTR